MSPLVQVLVIIGSAIMLGVSIYLLSIFNRLFARVRNTWLRKNLAVLLVALSFMFSLVAISSEMMMRASQSGMLKALLVQLLHSFVIATFVFNVVWLVRMIPSVKNASFVRHHAVVITTIILSALFIYSAINYVSSGMKFKELPLVLTFAFYNACATGLIYTALSYVDLDRKRKLNEKELELTRLSGLKTKAELDALHSKVNPHFLYNALNSIADLSITDGKKARKMTIALADLFRYSINYNNNNYSTIGDELEMAGVYLQIEKIRFEDKLTYHVEADPELRYYLIPRFILQPLVENAVKHGLRATGQLTEISVEVKPEGEHIRISVADTGPGFPAELNVGYGVKSVYDKLDLLFPGEYEVYIANEPRKEVKIIIKKRIKNEPAV
ncbi:MAG TPA: histidine kinase [Chitinophagaceae bacterium]|nr:histidine kinase [Chitinophagaceae bacterium]